MCAVVVMVSAHTISLLPVTTNRVAIARHHVYGHASSNLVIFYIQTTFPLNCNLQKFFVPYKTISWCFKIFFS